MDPDDTVLAPAMPSGVPAEVGRYRVSRLLGRGGMGVVLLAEDPELDREVAIKLVSGPDGVSPPARARFAREAKSAARLNHPNIATIYDVGEIGDQPYLAMEYVRGESLAQRLRHGRLSLERCVGVLRQLASALAEAHAASVVHRDLKPGNVMLSAAGTVKLLDFGLAHGGTSGDPLTKTGAMLGTPAYMSPEQVRGERVSLPSDVFSLGVVAYEVLTGTNPFLREGIYATLTAIATHEPPAVSTQRRDVPIVLDALITACLSKDAADRPAASAVVAALDGDLSATRPRQASSAVAGRVAVTPLRNVSRASDFDWVGVGLVDTLGHELRRSEGTTLADVGATAALAEEGTAPLALGERLGAEWVVTGSFQIAGPLLRVTCSVLHVPDGEETSCERIDGTVESIFDVQDRVVAAVRTILETRRKRSPSGKTLAAVRPRDMRAYEAYSRGLLELRTSSESGVHAALTHFRRALALDPDYADAWTGFGAVLQVGAMTGGESSLEESIGCLERAIALDPEHALAHAWLSQAWSFKGDYRRGLEVGQRAVELDPAHLDCWLFLGMNQLSMTFCLGDGAWIARGQRSVEQALAVAPHYASIHHNLGILLLMVGDLASAEDHFRTAETLERGGSRHERWPGGDAYIGIVDLFRGDLDAAEPRLAAGAASLAGDDHLFVAPMSAVLDLALGELLLRRDRLVEAHEVFAKVERGARGGWLGSEHATMRAKLGLVRAAHRQGQEVHDALAILRAAILAPDLRVVWGYDLVAPSTFFDAATAHAEVGDFDHAIEFLTLAVDHGLLCAPRLDTTPAFEPLRSDERLLALRARMAAYEPLPRI